MVVVDTNILVYLLMEGDRTKQAQNLFAHDSDWRSEPFLLAEFSNVLATYLRSRLLTRAEAERLLREAQVRIRTFVTVPHLRALRVADEFGISAYDARFVAIAQSLRTRLLTEDARLRRAVPHLTASLEEALAAH